MVRIQVFLCLCLGFGVAPEVYGQTPTHPGVQQPIMDGCEGMQQYDEAIQGWICHGAGETPPLVRLPFVRLCVG